jgi:enamine deaminase RidA (YjgF/YER057c/UK114 family)
MEERSRIMQVQPINPWSWQDDFGFVQANLMTGAKQLLICSGQMSTDASGTPIGGGDMSAQVATVMDNLSAVLESADLSLADVIKLTIYTTDVDAYLESHGTVATRMGEAGRIPAMTLLGVTRLAFPELLVEIEAIALR